MRRRREYQPPRRAQLPDPKVFPLPMGGSFTSGDPSTIPPGFVYSLVNLVPRANNRYDARPPFVFDFITGTGAYQVNTLMLWSDTANRALRFVVIPATAFTQQLYAKDLSGVETYAAIGQSFTPPLRITDFATLRGVLYFSTGDGITPNDVFSFDGGSSSSPLNNLGSHGISVSSYLTAVTVSAIGERVVLGNVGVVVPLNNAIQTTSVYDPTTWTLTTAAASNITGTAGVVGRISPTAATGAQAIVGVQLPFSGSDVEPLRCVYRADIRGVSATYRMPMKAEIYLDKQWAATTAYTVANQLIVPTTANKNGFRYRPSVLGTTAGGEPAWPTTIGGTVVDGTVTWVCDGPDVIGSTNITVPTISEETSFASYFCDGFLPAPFGVGNLSWRLKFGNDASASVTANIPVDISFKDGVTNGQTSKRNFGQQFTYGDFKVPFCNVEPAATTTIKYEDRWYWSELGEGGNWRSNQYWALSEYPGPITAAVPVVSRQIFFKRNAFWLFRGTDNPDLPFSRERYDVGVGCVHPRALDVFEKTVYFIGENEVYRMTAEGEPEPLCGDAMREEIMARGSDWVESQSTYKAPLLTINAAKREVWIYTQKGVLYCYHIDTKRWSKHEFSGNPQVVDMLYFPGTQKVYVSFGGHGLTRMDPTSSAKDSYDNTGTTFDLAADIIFKPIELIAPRFEMCLHDVAVFHLATADQTGQTTSCSFSFDRGATFPTSDTVTFSTSEPRISFAAMQTDVTITPKISHVGGGGPANWSISRAEMTLELLSGEWPKVQPTQSSSSLVRT